MLVNSLEKHEKCARKTKSGSISCHVRVSPKIPRWLACFQSTHTATEIDLSLTDLCCDWRLLSASTSSIHSHCHLEGTSKSSYPNNMSDVIPCVMVKTWHVHFLLKRRQWQLLACGTQKTGLNGWRATCKATTRSSFETLLINNYQMRFQNKSIVLFI